MTLFKERHAVRGEAARAANFRRWASLALALVGSSAGFLVATASLAAADSPQVTVSESSFDFGEAAVSQTVTHHFTITNNGTTNAHSDIESSTNQSAFGLPVNDTCFGQGLAAGASCGFDIVFQPKATGPASGSVSLQYNNNSDGAFLGDVTVDLSGTGTPQVTVSESSFDFGEAAVSQTVTHHFTITNNGTTNAHSDIESSTNQSAFGLPVNDTCFGQGLAAGASCGFDIVFQPKATGPASGSVSLQYNNNSDGAFLGDVTVDLAGTGVTVLAITPVTLPSGTAGTAYPATTLQTTGGTAGVHWSVSAGSLPPGLTLDPDTGNLTGTPTSSGVFPFTVEATDGGSPTPQTATQALSITVAGFADLAVSITGPAAPAQHSKPLTYKVNVTSRGPNNAHAYLAEALPAASQFSALTSSAGTCQAPPVGATGTIVCDLGQVTPGSTVTVTITIIPTAKKATIRTTATVTADVNTTDTVTANNSATAAFQIN